MTSSDTLPALNFDHLVAMTTQWGLFEHALFSEPRVEHGYCTDDVARALTVVVRGPNAPAHLVEIYLNFVERAVTDSRATHNRMSASGTWQDEPLMGDWWGRAVAALGFAARHGASPQVRRRAMDAFNRAARLRSPFIHTMSFAAIGAADAMASDQESPEAPALLHECLNAIGTHAAKETTGWGWPEPRLTYANAALCDALITGGAAANNHACLERGLSLLDVLLAIETSPDGHLSVTGSKGRTPGQPGPLWDQQAIEPAAIADACRHALAATGDPHWAEGIRLAWAWFVGDNDSNTAMYNATDGVGYDGLEPGGRNENCGAESTLAALSTLQHRRSIEAL
ncbi:MAG: hypothetical protein LBN10_09230 [Propionibacteriaceae bacterium]|jgi:hypothetical protein|nr:hypothetical protein [Propionibacteriaceae bacterium]